MSQLRATLGLLLFAVVCSAGEVYELDYDYRDQGDDWYGRSQPGDLRADYAPLTDIPSLNGDDFGEGYDPRFARMNQGPAILRTNVRNSAYAIYFQPAREAFFQSSFE